MSGDNIIGQFVRVNDEEEGLEGKVGRVISKLDGTILGHVIYRVEFDFDVGKYTASGKPSRTIGLPRGYFTLVKDEEFTSDDLDLDTLINLALDTKDKAWFDELIVKKHKISSVTSQLPF